MIASGATLPRNASEGQIYSKVVLRVTKDLSLGSALKASLIGEVYNLVESRELHRPQHTLSATNAATTARFGQCSAASISRQGQLAVRLSWR